MKTSYEAKAAKGDKTLSNNSKITKLWPECKSVVKASEAASSHDERAHGLRIITGGGTDVLQELSRLGYNVGVVIKQKETEGGRKGVIHSIDPSGKVKLQGEASKPIKGEDVLAGWVLSSRGEQQEPPLLFDSNFDYVISKSHRLRLFRTLTISLLTADV